MIRNLAVCLLIFTISACAPQPISTPIPATLLPSTPAPLPIFTSMPADSGIEGNVTIGPVCPVVQLNDPCPDQPYQATLTVLTPDQHMVLQFQTDLNGHYRVDLAPGEYILHPESPNVMPHAADIPFVLRAHQFQRLDIVYDSGIR